jgi:peptidoglycan/xylan/chitin deacetylase (PgdA/CDA1 family)
MTMTYPRDLKGHGRHPPHARWPGNARVAVQFVLNYEEGGENSVLHGDAGSEQFLSEMFNPPAFAARHLSMEGIYEYGARVGVWRLLREFERRGLPLTVFGVAWRSSAAPRSPPRSSSSATRSPRTAGAGSTTRTSTRRPSASTCARGWRSSRG